MLASMHLLNMLITLCLCCTVTLINAQVDERVKNRAKQKTNQKVDQIATVGHGEKQPVADNKTLERKALNRRVVFVKK